MDKAPKDGTVIIITDGYFEELFGHWDGDKRVWIDQSGNWVYQPQWWKLPDPQ